MNRIVPDETYYRESDPRPFQEQLGALFVEPVEIRAHLETVDLSERAQDPTEYNPVREWRITVSGADGKAVVLNDGHPITQLSRLASLLVESDLMAVLARGLGEFVDPLADAESNHEEINIHDGLQLLDRITNLAALIAEEFATKVAEDEPAHEFVKFEVFPASQARKRTLPAVKLPEDAELIAEQTRVETAEGQHEFQVAVIHWPEVHRPETDWKRYRSWKNAPSVKQIEKAQRSALRERRFFLICVRCGERGNVGHFVDGAVCQSCAERSGIVF